MYAYHHDDHYIFKNIYRKNVRKIARRRTQQRSYQKKIRLALATLIFFHIVFSKHWLAVDALDAWV
jgi:hypothetical protein